MTDLSQPAPQSSPTTFRVPPLRTTHPLRASLFPAGRIICSQFSSGVAVPLALLLLHLIPRSPALWYAHGGTLFTMGLLISWNAPATNNPIFAEIVPGHLRTAIYAFDRCFEVSAAPAHVALSRLDRLVSVIQLSLTCCLHMPSKHVQDAILVLSKP